jgi:hypothetical protein
MSIVSSSLQVTSVTPSDPGTYYLGLLPNLSGRTYTAFASNAASYTPSTGLLNVTAATARYADLAEKYTADSDYAPGTVVVFGGTAEVTVSTVDHDSAVAGVVSTNPAYTMNSECTGVTVALQGRVPCQVRGPVDKGAVLVTSTIPGVAQAIDNKKFVPGCVIGKALTAINTDTIETIEVVVGKH